MTGKSETIAESIAVNDAPVQSDVGSKTAPIQSSNDTVKTTILGETKLSTTQFIDDGDMNMNDDSEMLTMSKAITMMGNPQEHEDTLIDFLAKPIILNSGSFSSSDTFSFFNSYSMPYAALQSTNGIVWRQKLAGYFGMRMNMRVRLVVNANKFQQGRYIMGWTPVGGSTKTTSNLKNVSFVQMHNATLIQRTTVHHVEIDLASDTTAELVIPFVSAYKFYPLNTILASDDYSSLGYLNIYPYSPLAAVTGNTACGYTIYVSFEEVSLYGAASAQGGGKRQPRHVNEEVANKQNGPVSGISSAISRGFKEFKNIPMLGEFATGVSWIADRVTNVASVFGFSKPTAGDSMGKMIVLNNPVHSTVDGDSDARALSYMSKPGVVPIDGLSGTALDEMDFSFIKTKYAWITSDDWTVGQIAGVTVRDYLISPVVGEQVIGGARHFIPVSFLSKHFYLWRGSMKIRLKLVKTEYHSGRLQVAFYPRDEYSYTGQQAYVNRMIVDIREHNEIEIVVPYISRSPWTPYADHIGTLRITVVDPLVAPSSVTQSVNIICELAGGDDYEVSGLAQVPLTPTVIVPQGGGDDTSNMKIVSTTIGNTEVRGNPLLMSSLCIGDKVSSVRALLKRYCKFKKMGVNTNSTLNLMGVRIVPDMVNATQSTTSVPVDYFAADFISIWASCYLFMSGGIRIKDIIDYGIVGEGTDFNYINRTPVTAVLASDLVPAEATVIQDVGHTVLSANYHRVIQDTTINNTISLEVPQYTRSFTRTLPDILCFQDTTMANNNTYTASSTATTTRLYIFFPNNIVAGVQTGYTLHNVYRAAADDFNLSGFISVPPFVTTTGTDYANFY